MAGLKKLQFNNRTILTPSRDSFVAFIPEEKQLFPSDMDFIYLANNYNGSQIPNVITTSDMGPYLKSGTITKNGSGSSCYLSSSKSTSDDLYINLTSTRLNAMKAASGTYTFFFRVINTTSGIGGILVWRNSDSNYIYMIRSNGNQVQVHFTSGTNLGTTNFSLATDNVYKVSVSGNNYLAKNLTSGYTWTTTNSSTKAMGTRMHTFYAGSGSETSLDRFYGCAGIARATTDAEDTQIKEYLLSQGV